MINYILLSVSMLSIVLQNGLFNSASKTMLKTKYDRLNYNAWLYLICFFMFAMLCIGKAITLYSVILGLSFGIATMLSNHFKITALGKGPLHITNLIAASSMIIPALSGAVMFGEKFSIGKAIAILLLILFIYISLKKDKNTGFDKSWVICCVLSFIFQGIIGVIQKIHQSSSHKNELFVFLAASFLFSFIFSRILSFGAKEKLKFTRKEYGFALVCGVCTFTMNYINLKLSGVIPSQIFFPLVNGSSIILTSLVSVFFFKEKLNKQQTIGLIGGIISLILICLI